MRIISLVPALVLTVSASCAAEPQAGLTQEMIQKTEIIAQALENIAPEGWVAQGPVERYTVDNLYDKINGRSELYMSYEVIGMTFVTIVPEDTADKTNYVDIFLYDMANAENAYGVYGVERFEGGEAVALGRDAYRTDTDLFLWHGQYYATLLGAADDPRIHEAAYKMAETLATRLKDNPDEKLWGMELMPAENRVEGTLQFFKVDAMSLDFMTNTYSANYTLDGAEHTFFLSRQPSVATATGVFAKYQAMLQHYGDGYVFDETNDPPLASADLGGGYFDVVFQYKHFIGGISAAQNLKQASAAALQLLGQVRSRLDKDNP